MDAERAPLPKRTYPIWHPSLEPLDTLDDATVELPLLGLVSAGLPVVPPEIEECLSVPARLVRRHGAGRSFALYVRGDSMTEDGIDDGDLVVVESRPTAENGETVVACLDDYQVTLKRFYQEPDGIRLQPANAAMDPLRLEPDAVQVLGVVTGVVRMG
ncbi:MAG: peptidase [Sphingobacteriia bacterium]|nr:peptidase [Sphingobacteriia bacterium]NCC41104.1 peptidase [Gammaproteobacteria bacterium]